LRLWTVHPKYLDARGLVALWREALLAKRVLEGRTRGYRHHPQLTRFRAHPDPVAAIDAYLAGVYEEACRRGYRFDATRGGRGLVALLDAVRRLAARVVCFDGSFESAEGRDAGMAAQLISALLPGHVTLVLCGNLHARTDDARWMGWHLRQGHELVSLDLGYDGGAAWNITDAGEGIHDVQPRWPGPRGIERCAIDGFDGVYRVGTLTPSEILR